jgi:hypothetical protein
MTGWNGVVFPIAFYKIKLDPTRKGPVKSIVNRQKYKGYRGSDNKEGGWNKQTPNGIWTKLIISGEMVAPQKNVISSRMRDIRARAVARVEDDVVVCLTEVPDDDGDPKTPDQSVSLDRSLNVS